MASQTATIKALLNKAIRESEFKKDIAKISLFGSYANEQAKEESDIDLLVEFNPQAKIGLFRFVQIQRNLAKKIGKKIDLVTPQGLSKYIRNDVINNSIPIYEN